MRYRQRRSDAVYWPAFADILTVVVVVLVCMLVSVLESKSSTPPMTHPEKVQGLKGTGNIKPEPTRDEYIASLRDARARCLADRMRRAGLALTMQLCRFDDRQENACSSEISKLTRGLAKLNPDELTRFSHLDLGIQVRAVTELNGSFGVHAREMLAHGQETLRNTPLWSERLRDQTYQERPRSGAGTLYFDVTYRLQRTEQQEVERQWDDREYAALEQRRKLARSCEAQ